MPTSHLGCDTKRNTLFASENKGKNGLLPLVFKKFWGDRMTVGKGKGKEKQGNSTTYLGLGLYREILFIIQ
jgi:hypothetical protein